MTSMLKLDNVEEGQDPVSVQGRFGMTKLAAAIMAGTEENQLHWDAVHKEHQHIGPMQTAKELENYMLAWVGAVNTSAYDIDNPNWKTAYFDSADQTMRYFADSDDMVMNVDKLPFDMVRSDGKVRLQYPDYSGMEWDMAKTEWDNVKDNFTVPTGMYMNVPGCSLKPLSILTAVYNGLPAIVAKRRNPVTIKSQNFFIDSKVISVRTKVNADPMSGDIEDTYKCEPDEDYMESNPVRLVLYHKKPQKAKRSLLWHSEDYWSGLEVNVIQIVNQKVSIQYFLLRSVTASTGMRSSGSMAPGTTSCAKFSTRTTRRRSANVRLLAPTQSSRRCSTLPIQQTRQCGFWSSNGWGLSSGQFC